jgi:hypothetical protein
MDRNDWQSAFSRERLASVKSRSSIQEKTTIDQARTKEVFSGLSFRPYAQSELNRGEIHGKCADKTGNYVPVRYGHFPFPIQMCCDAPFQ